MKRHLFSGVVILSMVVGLPLSNLQAQHNPDCPITCTGKTFWATCSKLTSCIQDARSTRRRARLACGAALATASAGCAALEGEARKKCFAAAAAGFAACMAVADANYYYDKRDCCSRNVPSDCPDQVSGSCSARAWC